MQFYLIRGSLRGAKVTTVYKKNGPLDQENYLPESILFPVSKVYERAIFNQLSEHMQNFLNRFSMGFVMTILAHMLYLIYFRSDNKNLMNVVMSVLL